MRIVVVADTGPIHYLVLIGQIEILPILFERVSIPSVVRDELADAQAPEAVRRWAQNPPVWLEVHPNLNSPFDGAFENLDAGERAALILAASLGAGLLLIDDRKGVAVARGKRFRVIGTLRVLQLASKRGILELKDAFDRIKRTNFRYRQSLMDDLLNE